MWVYKIYLAGWGTHSPLDLNNPEHKIYFTNQKISEIFPNGTTEPVTLYTHYIGATNVSLKNNKNEINKGMNGEATVPGAEIIKIDRDEEGRLTRVKVKYDDSKEFYSLRLEAIMEMDKNTALISWMNPGGIFSNSGQDWGSIAVGAPYTHVDFNISIDERVEMAKEMRLLFKSYSFKHQLAGGELSSGRVVYKRLSNTIAVNDPVNTAVNTREQDGSGSDLTEFSNKLIIRTSIRNDGNPNYHTRGAKPEQVFEDMEIYTDDSNFFKIPKAVAEEIADDNKEPIKIMGNINGLVRPAGSDNPIPTIHAQDLLIDFTKVLEVKFDKNFPEGTETVLSTVNVEKNATINNDDLTDESMPASPTEFVQDGKKYTFKEWNTKADGTGTAFTGDTVVTEDMIVYAQWQKEENPDVPVDPVVPLVPVAPQEPSPSGNLIPMGYVFDSDKKVVESHTPFIFGYPDGLVKPEASITRGETAAIFARLMGMEKGEDHTTTYSDIRGNEWYANYIGYLEKKDIIKGYPDGTFRAEEKITRAEYAKIASKFAKSVGVKGFPDIEDHWAKAAIEQVVAEGWILGYPDGTYKPDRNITRAEAVKITNPIFQRYPDKVYIDKNEREMPYFNDLSNGHWAYFELMEAAQGHDYSRNADGSETWIKVNN
ncbi:MAG: hypothetical protein GXZ11_05940 [Tissierellia bacterium]|nr:hypothetical protein [Tissierellia bacterium]